MGGGLANTVGGVTEGLGTTVQSGGNIAREGLSGGETEGSATERAEDTATDVKSKVSEGVEEVGEKSSEITDTAAQKADDTSAGDIAGNARDKVSEGAEEVADKGAEVTDVAEQKGSEIAEGGESLAKDTGEKASDVADEG